MGAAALNPECWYHGLLSCCSNKQSRPKIVVGEKTTALANKLRTARIESNATSVGLGLHATKP